MADDNVIDFTARKAERDGLSHGIFYEPRSVADDILTELVGADDTPIGIVVPPRDFETPEPAGWMLTPAQARELAAELVRRADAVEKTDG